MNGRFFRHGFTLVELLVTLSILAILAGLAAPSFVSFLQRQAVNAHANEFADALRTARSEALKRGLPVKVCAIADPAASPPTCGTQNLDWRNGWIVTDGTNLILVRQRLSNSGGVDQNGNSSLTYQPTGIMPGGNLNFEFHSASSGGPCKKVTIRVGRPRISDDCSAS